MKTLFKLLVLTTIVLSHENLFSQAKTDSTYLKQIIDNTQSQLSVLNKTLSENLQKSQAEIDRLTSIIADT
ncbi:MAG: hypothetical protein KF803_02855 [Cyclobacteriaceae bacterium]|nr:hypothetical protein [Cyclobacteriaceae bacterium]